MNEAVTAFAAEPVVEEEVSSGLSSSLAFSIFTPVSSIFATSILSGLYVSQSKRQVVLQGTSTRLATGDYVLIVENQGETGEKRTVRQVSTVKTDKKSSTTVITWSEERGASYQNVTLHALRVTASAFGSTAPVWKTLPDKLTKKIPPDLS